MKYAHTLVGTVTHVRNGITIEVPVYARTERVPTKEQARALVETYNRDRYDYLHEVVYGKRERPART